MRNVLAFITAIAMLSISAIPSSADKIVRMGNHTATEVKSACDANGARESREFERAIEQSDFRMMFSEETGHGDHWLNPIKPYTNYWR